MREVWRNASFSSSSLNSPSLSDENENTPEARISSIILIANTFSESYDTVNVHIINCSFLQSYEKQM